VGITAALYPAVAGAATPYLQLIPSTVAVGQTVTAYGSDFCSAGCSAVTLTLGDQVVASGVQVAGDGRFQASFRVNVLPGSYTVTARQTTAAGGTLSASAFLQVAASDGTSPPPPPSGPPNLTSPSPRPSSNPASTPSPSSAAQSPFATGSAVGAWLPWALLAALALLALVAGFLVVRRRGAR